MEYFLLSAGLLVFLAACSETGVSNGEEQLVEVLESASVDEPEHGDIFVIETVDEEGDALNIHFEETGEGEELMLHSIDGDVDLDAYTLNFNINKNNHRLENLNEINVEVDIEKHLL